MDQVTRMACDVEIISSSPIPQLFVMDSWGRIFLWEGGNYQDWEPQGIPGLPELHAVAMEIASWRKAAVILRDDGALYEVPISCWLDNELKGPDQIGSRETSLDNSPHLIGNIFHDFEKIPFYPGRMAVDLVADAENQRLVVLDNTGDLVTDQPGQGFQVEKKAAYIGIDLELNQGGNTAFIGDYFGGLKAWPGEVAPIQIALNFNWPAVVDYETARNGDDLYVLDVQGGVFAFTRQETPFIDLHKMQHFSPHGEMEAYTPYSTYPSPFFCDIELVPGKKAYYRMLWNFGIYYGVEKE